MIRKVSGRFPCQPLACALTGALLLLGGCMGGVDAPATEPSGTGQVSSGAVRFNPNVRIGEVVWTNEQGDFAVVRMDAPRASFEPAFLLALDPAGSRMSGVLVGGGEVSGRSFGARVLEGEIPAGAEVRLPGPEWTEYLYNRYNRTERLPAPGGQPR